MVRKTLLMFVVVSLTTFGLVACSDDTGGNGGDGNEDAGQMTDTTPDDDTSELCANGEGAACSCVRDEFVAEAPASCSDSSPPDRCSADVISFSDWGETSVVTDLGLPSNPTDPEIGFDIKNEDGIDNALGTLLNGLSSVQDFDIDVGAQIKNGLLSGELILLAEHEGLEDLSSSDPFQTNFMFGEPADQSAQGFISKADSSCTIGEGETCDLEGSRGENFFAGAESFEMGVYPQAFVGNATIEDGKVTAGPGKVVLNITVPQIGPVNLELNGAKLEAEIADGSLSDDDGVKLTNGQIGGYLSARELYSLGNTAFSTCDCMGNPDRSFPVPEDADTEICAGEEGPNCQNVASCRDEIDASTCESSDSQLCSFAETACAAVPSLVNNALDLDTDCDGNNDAVSFGISFEATGANIEGVAPNITVANQTNDGSEVTISQVIAPDAGSVAVFEQGDDYTSGNLLGSETVSSGTNSEFTITLDSTLSSDTTLEVALFDDSGSTGGEYDADDSVVTYGPGFEVVEMFDLTVSGQ